jgi:general secretion pathway protein D
MKYHMYTPTPTPAPLEKNRQSLQPSLNGLARTTLFIALVGVTTLWGCAAPRHFGEGQRLIEAGETEKGISELREALRLEPNNAEYRLQAKKQENKYLDQIVKVGDEEVAQGDFDGALSSYEYVLKSDPQNEIARRKYADTKSLKQAAGFTQAAQKQLQDSKADLAAESLRSALKEVPTYEPALTLLRGIETQEEAQKKLRQDATVSVMKRPISLQFRDASVRLVFEAISRSVGLNVILDRDVRPDLKTTIFVKDASVGDAVDLILLQSQLEKRVLNNNTLFIFPATASKLKEYQELKVRVFQLSNLDAKYLQTIFKSILRIKDVVIDEKTNTVVIRDTPEAIAVAEKLVTGQDVPDAEVMLEVEVLEVSKDRMSNIGVKWPDALSLSLAKGSGPLGELTFPEYKALTRNNLLIGPAQLGVGINAKLIDSDANLLASPRIRVRHKEKARILIGDRVPFVSGSNTIASGATPIVSNSVQYLDVGIKLEVEPYIYSENDVGIKINMEVSNIAKEISNKNTGDVLYQIGTRSASTSLRLKDGETQVLAGLISDQERSSGDKVPGLGQTPLLGKLFSNNTSNNTKSEIVLSITPHIIRGQNSIANTMRDIWSGTDGQIKDAQLRLDPISVLRASSNAPSSPNLAPAAVRQNPIVPSAPVQQLVPSIDPSQSSPIPQAMPRPAPALAPNSGARREGIFSPPLNTMQSN